MYILMKSDICTFGSLSQFSLKDVEVLAIWNRDTGYLTPTTEAELLGTIVN